MVYAYGVIPLFELIFKPKSYEEKRVVSSDLKNLFFDSLLYLNFPIVSILLFYGFNVLSFETTFFYEEVGIVLSLAILLATNGINVAHELGHRKSGFAKNISKSLLLYSLYMHFFIEHNKGHHKNVGTPLDPASAKFNQSLYSFWVQSVIGQYINAWKIQLKELNTNSNSVSLCTSKGVPTILLSNNLIPPGNSPLIKVITSVFKFIEVTDPDSKKISGALA